MELYESLFIIRTSVSDDNIIKFLTIHHEKPLVERHPVEASAQESDGGRV